MSDQVRHHSTSREEEDLKARSSKKVKGGEHRFSVRSSLPVSYFEVHEGGFTSSLAADGCSYKDSLMGASDVASEEGVPEDDEWEEAIGDEALKEA